MVAGCCIISHFFYGCAITHCFNFVRGNSEERKIFDSMKDGSGLKILETQIIDTESIFD
jgi:hypothetical protein